MSNQLVEVLYSGNFGKPRIGVIVKEDVNYIHFVENETGDKMRIGHWCVNEIKEINQNEK